MVRLLWTGGWDSTFRLLQALLLEARTVQPIYVVSVTRGSTMQELRTMEAIRAAVQPRLPIAASLLPTQVHIGAQYPPRSELVRMRERIQEHGWLGEQYVQLAGVAEALGWRGVELCIQKLEGGPSVLQRTVLDEQNRLRDVPEAALLRCFTFPVVELDKADMDRIAAEHGFLDLLRMRWSCHQPIRDKPCGRCRPCRLGVREDVDFANPALAAARAGYRRARRLAGLPTA